MIHPCGNGSAVAKKVTFNEHGGIAGSRTEIPIILVHLIHIDKVRGKKA